jgi:phage terminase large subunit
LMLPLLRLRQETQTRVNLSLMATSAPNRNRLTSDLPKRLQTLSQKLPDLSLQQLKQTKVDLEYLRDSLLAQRITSARPVTMTERVIQNDPECFDPVHWIKTYCKTFDPRIRSVVPFDLFAHQETCVRWIQEREARQEDGIIEKARDSGISYVCCAYALHSWLFHPYSAIGFGSRKLEYVDVKGNPKSLFEKIRMMLREIPDWQIPQGFDWHKHDNYCNLINPSNGSSITGEGGDGIGRGGRCSIYFVDEAAFLERPDTIDRSLTANTNVRIDVSTPNGPGNPFATKRHSGRFPVFTFHWTDDPRKTPEWAEQKRADDEVTFAQEYDIDYTASVEGICIPAKWVRAAVGLFDREEFKRDYPNWKPAGDKIAGLDIAEEGSNKSVFLARVSSLVTDVVSWGQSNTTQTACRASEEAQNRSVKVVHYDVVGVGAGVKGVWETQERGYHPEMGVLPFTANAVNWGEPPTEDRWPDGKTSKELFVNLRAELAWKLRKRFERAYEFLHEGVMHAPEDMISIPNLPELISDLSLELYFRTETGKIQLESKKDMQRRGVKSPDYKDALAFSFVEPKRGIDFA